jgi:hypothetical protein
MKIRTAILLTAIFHARVAHAQPDAPAPSPKSEEANSPKAEPAPPAAPAPIAEPARPPTKELMRISPGVAPWQRETGWFHESTGLSWSGGLETDVGYAKYTHDATTFKPEDFYDFRGRFVLGPVIRYDIPSTNMFFRATGQLVGWIREQYGIYQVNVDDIYAQVGQYGLWDLMVGRFMTWRVYRKGLGFDLYTLEDTGALINENWESGEFHVHTYEVNYIFMREQPGRAAFHLYPTDWLGMEVMGVYGKDGTANTAGTRAAANAHFGILSLSGAAEYRYSRPALYQGAYDAENIFQSCDKCGLVKHYGFGGGAVFAYKPIEVGVNGAQGNASNYSIKEGTLDSSSYNKVSSVGGYAELDVGSLAFHKSLILGGGMNRTVTSADNGAFDRHVQSAAYVGYPLGFNNAMLKLVFSKADGHIETYAGTNAAGVPLFNAHNNTMLAARVRLSFNF